MQEYRSRLSLSLKICLGGTTKAIIKYCIWYFCSVEEKLNVELIMIHATNIYSAQLAMICEIPERGNSTG